jgi:hypothetical protein
VQVDPVKSTFTASGTKRLTLKSDEPLSNVAFKSNLRCYSMVLTFVAHSIFVNSCAIIFSPDGSAKPIPDFVRALIVEFDRMLAAGVYSRPLLRTI